MMQTATKLINRFGQAAVLRKTTGPQNPWDPPEGTTTDYPATVAVTHYEIADMDSTLIDRSDLRVFMAVADAAPATSDTLTIGGVDYVVVSVSTLGPDGRTICHDVQVRR